MSRRDSRLTRPDKTKASNSARVPDELLVPAIDGVLKARQRAGADPPFHSPGPLEDV